MRAQVVHIYLYARAVYILISASKALAFLASIAGTKGIEGTSGTVDVNGKSFENQKIAAENSLLVTIGWLPDASPLIYTTRVIELE
jgi:hypothetical protein